MNRLIINTANENLNIVLVKNDKVFFVDDDSSKHHNETMLVKIDELLKSNDTKLKDIAELGVVIGPGSFTGIRVGIATIKAFRDVFNLKAKGVNNLDFLFKLATSQYKDVETVAILGSKNSYFVAKLINDVVYKYERNLTKEELIQVADNKPIGMFKFDENLDCRVVKFDAGILNECVEESVDFSLTPVYYQLSQAENEKLKKGEVKVEVLQNDFDDVYDIQKDNIFTNPMNKDCFKNACFNEFSKVFLVKFNDEIAGYVLVEATDELCIESIAVKKEYRNLGLGSLLVNSACEYAKQLGFKTVSLEVGEKNITAYLLYKKLGFKIRRVRKKYYSDGTNCLEMVKEI